MIDNERKKKLLETLKNFNKGQKEEILSFGNESEDIEIVSTGIKKFDDFVGGCQRGKFTVIYGGQSVGKSTLVLQAIANAQKDKLLCCYIDLEHTFDKDRAKILGVNLENLVLAEQCQNAEQALEIIRTLCKDKVIDLIVVDSIQAMSPKNEQENKGKERELASKEIAELARTLSKFFRVVSPDVYRAKASVIMIGQVRIAGIGSFYTHADMTGGEALKHWASTRCFIRRGQKSDSPVQKFKKYLSDPDGKIHYKTDSDQIGFDAVIKLEKTKSSTSATEGTEIHLPFLYDKGFVNELSEPDEIPIKIDTEATEEERKLIEDYLVEKKPEEAKQLGLIEKPKEPIKPELRELHEGSEAPKPEQEKIKDMMIEKGILKNEIKDNCEKIAQKYESRDLDQTLKEEVKLPSASEQIRPITENKPSLTKKKRGRPKKEKNNGKN